MPRPSAHRPPSAATAPTATVLRPAIGALLVARRRWSAMFCAGPFHFLGVLAAFFFLAFLFYMAKSFFHFFQFVRIETFGFVFSCRLFIHVRITHRFHQFITHGNQLLAGLAQNLLFQLFELSHVQIFFKAGKITFLFFYFFFLNHAARLRSAILLRNFLSVAASRSPCLLLLCRGFQS